MKIALIDDNTTVLAVNEALIKKSGILAAEDSIEKFTDTESFFEQYAQGKYGLVVCDHDLGTGKMKGADLLSLLRNMGSRETLALLTGDDSLSMSMRMKNELDIHYIVKNGARNEAYAGETLMNVVSKAKESSN